MEKMHTLNWWLKGVNDDDGQVPRWDNLSAVLTHMYYN